MTNIQKFLKEFGLNDKEIQVYATCLKLGPSYAAHIAKKAGLKRSTCYAVLEELIKKSLILKSGTEKRLKFFAEKPQRILSLLKEKKAETELLEKKFIKLLPEFESVYDENQGLPKIKFLKGVESIKMVHEDMHTLVPPGGEYWHCGPDMKTDLKLMGEEYLERVIQERVKLNIRSKAITERTPWIEGRKKKDKKEKRQLVFFPKETKPPARLHIYANKVAIFSLDEEPTGVLIESKSIADMMRILFKSLWKECSGK